MVMVHSAVFSRKATLLFFFFFPPSRDIPFILGANQSILFPMLLPFFNRGPLDKRWGVHSGPTLGFNILTCKRVDEKQPEVRVVC